MNAFDTDMLERAARIARDDTEEALTLLRQFRGANMALMFEAPKVAGALETSINALWMAGRMLVNNRGRRTEAFEATIRNALRFLACEVWYPIRTH